MNSRTTATPSPAISPRRAYERGASLQWLRRRYGLTDGELRDLCPEEFIEDHPAPEGETSGY